MLKLRKWHPEISSCGCSAEFLFAIFLLQAKEISYTSLLNLNNLIIQVDTSDGSPSAHDEGENDSEDAEGDKAAEGNGVGAGSRIDDTAQIRTEESCEDELGAAETEVR